MLSRFQIQQRRKSNFNNARNSLIIANVSIYVKVNKSLWDSIAVYPKSEMSFGIETIILRI